jgi:hypothetical protein
MVLNYLGLVVPYPRLVSVLGTRWFGTPFYNVQQLEQMGVVVSIEHLFLDEISDYLEQNIPVLACVNTADLSYWSRAVDHVVVVIGIDESYVYVNDPSLAEGKFPIPVIEFELAQLNYDSLGATIRL